MSPRDHSRAIVLFHERVKLHEEAVKKPFLLADASLPDGLRARYRRLEAFPHHCLYDLFLWITHLYQLTTTEKRLFKLLLKLFFPIRHNNSQPSELWFSMYFLLSFTMPNLLSYFTLLLSCTYGKIDSTI